MRYLLDTSVWLRAAMKPETIPTKDLSLLETPGEVFGLSMISVWEVAKKVQKGKLDLPFELKEWLKREWEGNLELLDLRADLIIDATSLPDFPNQDPADEIIVATARFYDLTLITTDSLLKDYPHARIHYFKPQGR